MSRLGLLLKAAFLLTWLETVPLELAWRDVNDNGIYFLEGCRNWGVFARLIWEVFKARAYFQTSFLTKRTNALKQQMGKNRHRLSSSMLKSCMIKSRWGILNWQFHLHSRWRPGLGEIQVFQNSDKYSKDTSMPLKIQCSVKIDNV